MSKRLLKEHVKADKALTVATKDELNRMYLLCLNLSKEELLARLEYQGITIFEESMLRAIVADMGRGEFRTIEKMADRLFGKVVQPINAQLNVTTLEELVAKAGEVEDTSGDLPNIAHVGDDEFFDI
jgi:hypothetical protein